MKCPKCGNEVNQDEAFCGQCGTPMMPRPQATQMVQAPRNGQLNSYNSNMPSQPNKTGVVPPTNPYNPNNANRPAAYGGNSIAPNANQLPAPNQAAGFYQDATEAMSVFPPGTTNQVYPPGYPQQGFGGTPIQGGYPGSGQYNPQVQPPMPAGNYTQHGFPQTPQFPVEQGYSYAPPPQPAPTSKKQKNSAVLVIASVCLVVAILAVVAFGAIYLLRGRSSQRTSVPTPVPTSIPTPTVIPSPTPTPVATATPTPIPSPTVAPTPAPDANFSWCTSACTTNGFIVEFPNGWNQGQTSDKTGVQFLNPSSPDAYAAFKTPGATTSTANALITNDLTNFTSQPGYAAPTTTDNQTIGGTNWTFAIAHYTLNSQVERIEVFATVYQGKAYIIELQAAESQFDSTYYPTYFQKMINSFQFQQSTT